MKKAKGYNARGEKIYKNPINRENAKKKTRKKKKEKKKTRKIK